MGFLYPLALFSALAAAIPILLHFWRREQQQPPNLFPGVYFLIDPAKPIPHQAQPLTWLLTLLRVLLVGLLALLIAGPYRTTSEAQSLPEQPVLLALVIDDSPSMGLPSTANGSPAAETTRLAAMLAETNRLIDRLPAGSGLIWTTTSGRFHPLQVLPDGSLPTGRSGLHLTVEQLPIGESAGDLGRALDRVANAALELAYPQRQVVVVSDLTVGMEGPRTRERTHNALRKLADRGVGISLLDTGLRGSEPTMPPPPAPRLKILSFDRPAQWRVGRPVTLAVQVLFDIEPPGTPPRTVANLTWTLGAETIEQNTPSPVQSVDLPCGLRLQRFELVRRFDAAGWWKIEAAASIDADRQDRLTTALAVAPPTPVWLVEPPEPAGDSRYLALAIDPSRSGGGETVAGNDWQLLRKNYADLQSGLPENGVLVLWGAGRDLPAADWDRIAAAAAQGMGVWFVPDGGALPSHRDHPWLFWSADGALGIVPLLPRRLNRPAPLQPLPIRGQPNNPIRSAVLSVGGGLWSGATVGDYYPVRLLEGGADLLLAVDAGADALNPGLIEKPLGRGVGLLMTVAPVAGNGGWVQSEAWPFLAGLALERLAPSVGEWPDVEVGRPLNGQAGGNWQPPFQLRSWVGEEAAQSPARWALGAPLDAAESPAVSPTKSRPVGHFFRDGRFHYEGEVAPRRALLVFSDARGRLVGMQGAQVAAREWDDTRLPPEFWALPRGRPADATGANDPVAGVGVQTAADAEAILQLLRENETQAAAKSAIAVTIHGDLTPWVLALLAICALPWMYFERREAGAA